MDQQLSDYANSIYEKEMMSSTAELQKDVRTFLRKRASRNSADMPWSGIDVQSIISAHAKHIERCVSARLSSYQLAFQENSEIPSEEEFTEILEGFQSVRKREIPKAAGRVKEFIKARGGFFDGDFDAMLSSASAYGHDQTLRDWKIWRGKARISRKPSRTMRAPMLASNTEYQLHPAIRSVSGQLYRDGHYKPSVFEAFVCVINRVKEKAQLDEKLDGETLMNHVFGIDSKDGTRIPRILFNSCSNRAERDEQRGIMNLFKGICGVRDFKAHTNVIFDSPERAFEYLALASLLMRLLDMSSVKETHESPR